MLRQIVGGGVCAIVVSVMLYGDSVSTLRLVSVSLIIAGIIGLKLAHGPG